jgi:hypothetical protein
MYSKNISSQQPVLFLFLVDSSGSMSDTWSNSKIGTSLAEGAATSINQIMYDLSLNACIKDSKIIDRIHIAVYNYNSIDVEWALPFNPNSLGWAKAEDWVTGFTHREEVTISEDGDRTITQEVPIWITPSANGGTPMCAALNKASDVVQEHAQMYPDSFPPTVINITDGWPTDGNWQELKNNARKISSVSTNDGPCLLFNIHLTSDQSGELIELKFPSDIPEYYEENIKNMAEISSILPANMVLEGRQRGHLLKENAKGFILNADQTMLSEFLKIGTTQTPINSPMKLLEN